MAFLRNPLAWYKRYVENIRDTPSNPSSIVGRAAHVAMQHFYGGIDKDGATALGLEYMREVGDFEINFGKAKSKLARKLKRQQMERDYLQAVGFYLLKPPRHKVLGVEVSAMARVPGLPIPIKAISDLVIQSRTNPDEVDIVDHKFVDAFSKYKSNKTLFVMQAMFNYYVIREKYQRPVGKFIVYECKKKKNADGRPQLRKYVINFAEQSDEFRVFHKLLNDATQEIMRRRIYLPNPSDMFEGEDSFNVYRMGLVDER